MRTFILILCLTLTASVSAIDISTRIDAVTVHGTGATVTRVGTVTLEPGDNRVVVRGLGADLDTGQFRVELGQAGLRLGNVAFDVRQERDALGARARELTTRIDTTRDRLTAINDDAAAAELQLKFLEGLAQGYAKETWADGTRGNLDVAAWREAVRFVGEASGETRKTLRGFRITRRDVERDLARMERELGTLRGRELDALEVTLSLYTDQAVTTDVRIHYYQDDAGWHPVYVAKLDTATSNLRFAQRASVSQHTGEDWMDVLLTLSTSDPGGDLAPPEVTGVTLDLFEPRVADKRRMGQVDEIAVTSRTSAAQQLEEVVMTAARRVVAEYEATWVLPGRVTVANEMGDEQQFDLAERDLAVTLGTRVVPRASELAFLVARFTWADREPLPGGFETLVFVDEAYVGDTWFDTALAGDEVVLPMGQDKRVAVTVRDQAGMSDESGVIGRRRSQKTDFIFEIENRHTRATDVEVFDYVPTAVHADIKVSIPREATAPTERDVDDEPGVFAWRKRLPAGDSWRIRHGYEVAYPAARRLIEN